VTTEIFRGISRKIEFSASENEIFREIPGWAKCVSGQNVYKKKTQPTTREDFLDPILDPSMCDSIARYAQ
jgi:hypothetical protein